MVWSYAFALVLNRLGEDMGPLVAFITAIHEFLKVVVDAVLGWFPVGVLFIVIRCVIEVQDWETAFRYAKFLAVVLLGLVIQGTCLSLAWSLVMRHHPGVFIKSYFPALKTAFLSSSSSATLPLTLRCCEERLLGNRGVTRFMFTVGTNVNAHGTALYLVVAAVFVTQLTHIHLGIGQLSTMVVTSAVLSAGAAGVPTTGSMTTFFVLAASGLPVKETFILVIIEWILDRFNTVINVMGNCFGVELVHHLSRDNPMDLENWNWEGCMASMLRPYQMTSRSTSAHLNRITNGFKRLQTIEF
ncbi:excitatory amino acid transporter 3-like [Cebidichthys violaceus]|uniref:excitatory amino acid transporter 3-like n=1 Tax=Cebidichthys violaceus TaxID=271503 RepID=UPI0035CBCB4F